MGSARRTYSVASVVAVQVVGMGRFADDDCTLRPYIFTIDYDTSNGALISEIARLASPSIAASMRLPVAIQIC